MLVLIVLALVSTAHALSSPVSGPWYVPYTVDVRVSYANTVAGLVQVDVSASPHMIVTQSGASAIVIANTLGPFNDNTGLASQEGALIYGIGTDWTPAVLGAAIDWGAGNLETIIGMINASTLIVSVAQTIPASTYNINYGPVAFPQSFLPANGYEGTIIDTSLGKANVMISNGGELVLWLVNNTATNRDFLLGDDMHWDAPFTFRYLQGIGTPGATYQGVEVLTLLPIQPTPQPIALPAFNGQSIAVAFQIGEADDLITATFLGTFWQWNSSDYTTPVITFGARLPRAWRPRERINVLFPLNVPTFALASLIIEPYGTVTIHSPVPISSPASFLRGVPVTYQGGGGCSQFYQRHCAMVDID